MFTPISQLMYQSKIGKEHIWLGQSIDSNVQCILPGSLLGGEVRGRWIYVRVSEWKFFPDFNRMSCHG